MKIFGILPLAFCIAARALPTASPISTNPRGVLAEIKAELDSLGLRLSSPISALVSELGLDPTTADAAQLLSGLVSDVDGLLDKVDDTLDGLLGGLGLGSVVVTIDEVEGALGLTPRNSIRSLLNALGVLRG